MSGGYLSKDRAHLAELQRQRRQRMTRIDYMPDADALAAIEAKRATCRPGSMAATNSAVIDAIVREWAILAGFAKSPAKRPELSDTSRGRASASDFEPGRNNVTSTRAGVRANDSGAARSFCPNRAGVRARTTPAMLTVPRAGANKSGRVPCGARRRRDGQPCEALSVPGKRRCKWHGGCSTGPRTSEGKARALANLRQNRKP